MGVPSGRGSRLTLAYPWRAGVLAAVDASRGGTSSAAPWSANFWATPSTSTQGE